MLHHQRDHGVPLARPFAYRGLLQRWLVALGLRRSSAGGFGGTVPQPSSGGHG
jgi:hypothetical protein